MKCIPLFWIILVGVASAAPDSLSELRRQVEERERQIRQLEVENSRLRYMLTEAAHHSGDPLYGAKVSVNSGEKAKLEPNGEKFYLVSEGDTLSEIAAERRVAVDALVALNQLSNPATIRAGQRLRLPKEPATESRPIVEVSTPETPQQHIVGPGENLYRISLRYGIELDELLLANAAIDPRKLRVGQRVHIPRSEPILAGGG